MTSSDADTGPNVPGLIPEPREITLLGGMTELSGDVRLVTSNVLPLQRKAMRGILAAAGVRVVANKKKFVIEARVEDIESLDVADVPPDKRDEYYEMTLRDNRVFIRTASQAGALWGIHVLAGIYYASADVMEAPNLVVRDWPAIPWRGIFVESKWGPDRMEQSDWCVTIDRLASLRMNVLGVGIYGCWGNCRNEGQPTEFLMTPAQGTASMASRRSSAMPRRRRSTSVWRFSTAG